MRSWYLSLGLASFTLATLVLAAPTTSDDELDVLRNADSEGSSAIAVDTFEGAFPIGEIDIRPTYYPDNAATNKKNGTQGVDGFGLENNVILGAQLTEDTSIAYSQAFNANITNANSGKDFTAGAGFIRTSVANLWTNSDESLTLSYQNRVYVPTAAGPRNNGQITTVRNYLSLTKTYSDAFSLTASLVPIFHIYNRSGNGASANPMLENRVYLIPTINVTPKLAISLPLFFHQNFSRPHQGLGSKTTFVVWTWPDIMYTIDANNTIGVAYYNESLFTPGLGRFEPGDGGAFQFVYKATL